MSPPKSALSPPKCISSCTSDNVIKFLISRDKTGRTVVHTQSCLRVSCSCPSHLAAGSADSLLGKLSAIFNNIGHSSDSNPVAHPRVKEYLNFIREEQAARAILPSQAVPLFFAKFTKLIDFLRGLIRENTPLAAVNKYILVRDTVFFVVDFFTGDRASDLGRLLANQVFRLKDRKGFLLQLTLTKTTRGSATSPFILEPFEDAGVCPVAWIEYYLSVCNLLHIVLDGGYFFRATDRGRAVSQKPFLGSAVNNRLWKHLTGAKLNGGETPHSFRLGLSNTLNMLGCLHDDISRYLGWRSGGMARHYTRMSSTTGSFPIPASRSLRQTPASHPSNLQCIV